MKKALVGVALGVLLGATASSQEATKPGLIRGRITAADTGKPLRRTTVTLLPATGTVTRTGIGAGTSSQGTFELKDVPPGSYFVSASRAGYVALQHGQRRPGERGTVIDVGSGQTVERIDIALPRGSILAGRVADELGEPYPGVRVIALELRYQQGRRLPFPAGFATTDDLGQYRIAGLPPGSYYVSAASQETWRNEKKETLGYATAYYPGGGSNPQTVVLGVAQERLDLDFRLTASRTVRISGRVQSATGEALVGEPVTLAPTVRGANFTIASGTLPSVRTQASGVFEFRDITPGEYLIRAGSPGEAAFMFLAVLADVENLLLIRRIGSTVSGTIVTDDGTPPPFPASGVRLNLLSPDDNVLPTVRLPAVNGDWSFRLTNLGGPFLFRVNGLSKDWMLDAVKLNDRDLTDVPWDVPTGGREITGLQLVLTQKVGTITGEVVSADRKPVSDATVVVFSEDRAAWTPGSRFVRSTRPTSDGQFSIAGLPAGTYLVVARDVIVDGQWEDPAFLESMRKDAATVELSQGGSGSVTLKLPAVR